MHDLMPPLLAGLEATALAGYVRQSLLLTAGLSGAHVVGFALIMSGALMANLRLAGAVFRERPMVEIVRPATVLILAGGAISLPTGLLLFSTRAAAAAASGAFQLKMLLLLAAVVAHFAAVRPISRHSARASTKYVGIGVLCLWAGAALAACAFILLE